MKIPTMEAGVKSDQGYESFDSLSACGSERKSSLSDAEFDPISDDDEEDDYRKPGLEDRDVDDLCEQLRDGATLLSRAPMKNIDNGREMRRENAQPWSVQTQNSVTPSGGRVIRGIDPNTNYMLQNYERAYNGQQTQNVFTNNLQAQTVFTTNLQAKNVLTNNLQATNGFTRNLQAQNVLTSNLQAQNILTSNLQTESTMTGNLQSQNLITCTFQPQNVLTSVDQRNDFNITDKNNPVTSTNFISKNLTSNSNFMSKNQTNNDIYIGSGVGKNLPSYEVASKHLSTDEPGNNPINIIVQPPSVSSDDLTDELQDPSEDLKPQEFVCFRAEEENSSGSDFSEYIRYLFPGSLPELSGAEVSEALLQLDKNDFGKISPLSFSSTIVPPSVDSYPSSPTDCDLLAALIDQDALGASLNAAPANESVVPDFISILPTSDSSAKQNATGNLLTISVPTTTNYSSPFTSTSEYSIYTSSTNSFLDIRGQRGSFSTSSTPSHPGSFEYSPQSSADSQPSPLSSDLEQQFSPNIIPVTVNDDLGEDDGSRLDTITAKKRLLQRIRADATLKKAKDAAWLAASMTEPDKLIIAIQDLCGSVDHSVEAKFYANMEVFIDNASQEQIVQLFESVRFQRCANVVNNPLLNAYVCEIMLERGVE